MRLEDLGLIGNCQFAALVEKTGDIVWCCLPRFDSDPVFARLLDEAEGARFSVEPASGVSGRQSYVENTNVLSTVFQTDTGTFRVLDFAPRFGQEGVGIFHPKQLMRIIEPLEIVRQHVHIAGPFLPQGNWSRVLHVGTTDLHDVLPRHRLLIDRVM